MNQQTEDNITDIMVELDKPPIEDNVIRLRTQAELFRDSLTGFVQGQLGEISKLDKVINLGLNSLANRLDKDELNAVDTLMVVNSLTAKKTDLTKELLAPFSAGNSGPSPLLPAPKDNEDKTDFEQGLKEMSPEDLKIIEKVSRLFQKQ